VFRLRKIRSRNLLLLGGRFRITQNFAGIRCGFLPCGHVAILMLILEQRKDTPRLRPVLRSRAILKHGRNAGRHGRREPKRLMNAPEVVVHEVQRNSVAKIL
jgi:hypothetical protein